MVRSIGVLADRALAAMSTISAMSSTLFTIGLMILISLNIALRNFGTSMPGLVEGTALLMVIIIFLGLSAPERSNEHIAVDLMTRSIRTKPRQFINIISKLISAFISTWLCYGAFLSFRHSIDISEYQFGLIRFPIWPARLVVFIGLLLFTLETVRNALKNMAKFSSSGENGSHRQ